MFLSTYRFIPTASLRIRGVIATQASFSSAAPTESSTSANDRISTEDIVKKVAETHDLSLAETRRILKTTFDIIVDGVADKKQVSIGKFGTFMSSRSKEYTARNPKTGEPVHVPAKDKVKFRAYDAFKKTVSGSDQTP